MEEETPSGASNSGYVIGVPGPVVENVGCLDLRGASAEEVATLQKVKNTGSVLISPEARAGLTGTAMENVGSVIEAGAGRKTARGAVDRVRRRGAGGDGGRPEIPRDGHPDLRRRRHRRARRAEDRQAPPHGHSHRPEGRARGSHRPDGAHGRLRGRPEDGGRDGATAGEKTITPGYLSYLKPESVYINIGQTTFGDDVPLELVQSKLSAYVNVGQTVARQEILDYLDAICDGNVGEFTTPKVE